MGYFDDDGYFFFEGRADDVIKAGGVNVSPAEVEAVLRTADGVAAAHVVGMPDATKGDVVVAAVVAADGATLDPDALLAWLRPQISVYKVPRRHLRCGSRPDPDDGHGQGPSRCAPRRVARALRVEGGLGMSGMQFGSYAIPGHHGDFDTTIVFAIELEELGFDLIGVGDSPGLFRDPYVSMALLAQATRTPRLATMVTNPVLRHPAATAAAIGSVAELSGGRAVLGIGSGDSAMYNSGGRPATLGALEAHINAVRELLVEGETSIDGRSAWMRWRAPNVPIFVAASGPKTLRMAGRIADGVVVATGVDEHEIAAALACVAEGRADAGRDPASVEVWWNVITSAGRERDAAIESVLFGLSARAHHVFRYGVEGRNVPPELAPR